MEGQNFTRADALSSSLLSIILLRTPHPTNPTSIFSSSRRSMSQRYGNHPSSPSRTLASNRKRYASKTPPSGWDGLLERNQYHGSEDTDEINREFRERTTKAIDKLTTVVNSHSNKTSSLNDKVEILVRQTSEHSSRISSLDVKIDEQSSRISALDTKIDNQSFRISSLSARVNTKMDAIMDKLTSVNEQSQSMNEYINQSTSNSFTDDIQHRVNRDDQ